ncbi:LexA family transcriptional regulator [Chryseobacterium sp. Ch-15]|uniref:LexA family transcriptional regulator n=1 Tax=Chryseobacterium muglaense TaxID=2893752 RepID=A0A9Q3URQ9_9FLAO|nr:LexA family transcriptional regulator [Chryseobacterium muglaense]MBD3907276.1 LexA family transcriptional regulator [Chryseobacterium muglaense]MCC9033147.1 LexA family transcriptional regulator [Chryseobacterium muglaense]MCM2557025.1 LexA family transcriptional regulator [Chryseobacterium muglaense]
MSILSDNMRLLRDKQKASQQKISDDLSITRGRYATYEDGRSEPPIELLIRISKYFRISIDLLLTVDIRKYPIDEILNLPDNRIILPVVVSDSGENFIEIVPQKASMGYLSGYSDPEFIENLQKMQLPFLKNGKYRAFLADGDSMPPFADGSIIIGEYVEDLDQLKREKEYIFVTSEGITYKTFLERKEKSITVTADNSFYKPYDIALEDVLEVWSYSYGILPKNYKPYLPDQNELNGMIADLKKTVQKMEHKISGFTS